MSEEECTALDYERPDLNPLFVPPCNCPRCSAERLQHVSAPRNWLRVSGRRQRLHVAPVDLGPTGQAALG